MNQIALGPDAGIDTDHVQYWEMREGDSPTFAGTEEGPQTRVQFRNGKEAILRGEAKEAFDKWAKGRGNAGCDTEQIIDRIIAQIEDWDDVGVGDAKWREWLRECFVAREEESCDGPLARAVAEVANKIDCEKCRHWHAAEWFCLIQPECHMERKTKVNKPRCKTCACYDAESQNCTEFAGNHYPECWVAKKPERSFWENCVGCTHWNVAESRCHKAMEPWMDCPRSESGVPSEAVDKINLLGVWKCSCGAELARTRTWGSQVYGHVWVRPNGTVRVTCLACCREYEWGVYFGQEEPELPQLGVESCAGCRYLNVATSGCRNVGNDVAGVPCEKGSHHEEEERETKAALPGIRDHPTSRKWRAIYQHPECRTCRRYNAAIDLCMGLSQSYPTCHKEPKVGVASMCKGCRFYNGETELCAGKQRFEELGYPECYVLDEPAECGQCLNWHGSERRCEEFDCHYA